MSCKLNTTYPFPNYRDRQLQTRGRKQACQRATHLPDYIIPARLVSTGWQAGLATPEVNTTPTSLATLSGCATPVFSGVSDSLFSENIQYRIRNNESGNEGMSYKLTTTYPFPNYRDRQLQTRGRREACQRATHLTTLVNTPVKTTPTGLTTLSGWATLSGCGKNEIQFSRYLASGETVIHRAQAVRACLLPFFTFFLNNN